MRIDGTRSNDRATELVLAYCAALNRDDWPAVLALLGDGVAHDLNQGLRQVGKPAFAAYLQALADHHERLRDVVVLASPDGARAAAEYTVHGECGTAPANPARPGVHRQRYVLPGGVFFAIGDGLIQRVSNYHHRPRRAGSD